MHSNGQWLMKFRIYNSCHHLNIKESRRELAKTGKQHKWDMSSCFGAGNFGFHLWILQ